MAKNGFSTKKCISNAAIELITMKINVNNTKPLTGSLNQDAEGSLIKAIDKGINEKWIRYSG